jgi:uncharacterized damage-inducible protein DinB
LVRIAREAIWSDQIASRAIRTKPVPGPEGWSIDALTARLDRAAADLAAASRGVRDRGGYDDTWTETFDGAPRPRTFGTTIVHVITHSMHHRAQIIYMLKQLGAADVPEGDAIAWEDLTR